MSTTQRIQFTVQIHAPVPTVWSRMLGPESFKAWTRAFAEGSCYEGSWDLGAKIRFLSPSGDGMLSEIAAHEPHRFISIRHLGYIVQGREDTTSDAIRAWAPAYENYTFSATPEGTLLVIDQDATPEFKAYLEVAWPKALLLLKAICERASREPTS
jgi:hypothetical protein